MAKEDKPVNGWAESAKYVLKTLERNEKDHALIMKKLDEINSRLTTLYAKVGVYAIITAIVVSVIARSFFSG